MTFLEQWLARLADELNYLGQQSAFTRAWLIDGSSNKQSWLHSRVFGVMVRAVEHPLIPLVEVKWHRYFVADLTVVDKHEHVVAVIEYESTNSSDERLMAKDIHHYEEALLSYIEFEAHPDDPIWKVPEWWIIVSTLPNGPVYGWSWWPGYHDNTAYPPFTKDKAQRDHNPLRYYEAGLHRSLKDSWKRICLQYGKEPPCHLVWVNLTPESIDIKNINGQKLAQPTQFPLRLLE